MEKLLRDTLTNGSFGEVGLVRSRMMKAVKGKGNKTTELKFRLALVRARIFGWQTQSILIGKPDLFFPDYKIVVFLDGCFWHGCPSCGHVPKKNNLYWKTKLDRNRERDGNITTILKREGYCVIRFWEHELFENVNDCIEHVKDVINEMTISKIYNDWDEFNNGFYE